MPFEYGTGAIAGMVRMALDGTRNIRPQEDFAVAWLTYALLEMQEDLTWFEEYVAVADGLNHCVPTPDEVAWTFLQLRDRGWLQDKGDAYALTAEGRTAVDEIVGEVNTWAGIKRLEAWFASHPLGEFRAGEE